MKETTLDKVRKGKMFRFIEDIAFLNYSMCEMVAPSYGENRSLIRKTDNGDMFIVEHEKRVWAY